MKEKTVNNNENTNVTCAIERKRENNYAIEERKWETEPLAKTQISAQVAPVRSRKLIKKIGFKKGVFFISFSNFCPNPVYIYIYIFLKFFSFIILVNGLREMGGKK